MIKRSSIVFIFCISAISLSACLSSSSEEESTNDSSTNSNQATLTPIEGTADLSEVLANLKGTAEATATFIFKQDAVISDMPVPSMSALEQRLNNARAQLEEGS